MSKDKKFKHELGLKAKDKVTGIEGLIIGRTQWLTGCDTYQLQPKSDDHDNTVKDRVGIDEGRIEITGPGLTEKDVEADDGEAGGPERTLTRSDRSI